MTAPESTNTQHPENSVSFQSIAWKEFTKHSVEAKSGWFYLNQDIADKVEAFDGGGIYIYTDRYRWHENLYKIGETIRGEERVYEQGDAFMSEDAYIVDFIPLEILKPGFDKKVHNKMSTEFKCRISIKQSGGRRTEWIQLPEINGVVESVPYLVLQSIQLIENNVAAGREPVYLSYTQAHSLNEALKQFRSGSKIMLAELCPRFGKTIWALALFKHTNKDVMIVSSYVHSVFNSFKTEVVKWTQFADIRIATSEEEVEENKANGYRSVVLVPLTDKFDSWEKKHGWLKTVSSKVQFVDEADFGAHTPNQVKKVNYITENA